MFKHKKSIIGLTLLELVITIMFLMILTGVTVYVYRSVLLSWSYQTERGGLSVMLDRCVERMTRDFREAKAIHDERPGYSDEIRFEARDGTEYIYYLYNENDTAPPQFDQESYQLKRAEWSGFSQGDGTIVLDHVAAPPQTDLEPDAVNNKIVVDLSVSNDGETLRSRTVIYPRNL